MVRDVMLSQSLIAIRTALIMHVPTHDPTLAGLGWRTVGDSKFDSLLMNYLFLLWTRRFSFNSMNVWNLCGV